MDANFKIVERIKRIAGETRYCNCEAEGCCADHPCQNPATLMVEAFGIKYQSCRSCYEIARRKENDRQPTRNERIIESGYQSYAREEGHYDDPSDR